MTDPDRARKLIEEAITGFEYAEEEDDAKAYDRAMGTLHEALIALTLIPDWQEFDPANAETWPKEDAYVFLTWDEANEFTVNEFQPDYWKLFRIKWYRAIEPIPTSGHD